MKDDSDSNLIEAVQKHDADAGDILRKQDVEDRINLNNDQHKDGYITLCYIFWKLLPSEWVNLIFCNSTCTFLCNIHTICRSFPALAYFSCQVLVFYKTTHEAMLKLLVKCSVSLLMSVLNMMLVLSSQSPVFTHYCVEEHLH